MILDTIDRISLYASLAPEFQTAAAFLTETNLDRLEPGRIEIAGENVFAIVSTRALTAPNPVWEAHVRYADIQVVLAGAERVDWGGALACVPADYDVGADFCACPRARGFGVALRPGRFAIFLPQEIHRPGNPVKGTAFSKKLVMKVRV